MGRWSPSGMERSKAEIRSGLLAQDNGNSGEDYFHFRERQLAHASGQGVFIHTDDLGSVISHGILWETGKARRATDISRGHAPLEVAGQRNANNGGDAAAVQRITLDNNHWSSEPAGAGKSAHQISPCEITIHFAPGRDGQRTKRTGLLVRRSQRRPCSSTRLLLPGCGVPNTPSVRR